MEDLISRQAAIDYLIGRYSDQLGFLDAQDIIDQLNIVPSAQPEWKKGKWVPKSTNGEMFDSCSVCGYVEWDAPRNYCPNCGADMRGE